MKLRHVTASVSIFGALVTLACSPDDSIIMGGDSGGSGGTKSSAGAPNGSAGDRPLGGGNSGGTASGGAEPNGDAGAGETSAGSAAGGGSQAGSENGGSSSGGSSSGGSSSEGGAPASACSQDDDCVSCEYPSAPANAQQCYCRACANTAMTVQQCEANQAQYQAVCANVILPCPAVKCLPPPPAACQGKQCVMVK